MNFTQRVQTMNEVRAFYLQHETPRTQDLLRALSSFARRLGGTFLIGGSVGFGQAEHDSDLDITFVGPDLPRFRRHILPFRDRLHMDHLDYTGIDLTLVTSAIEGRRLPYDQETLEQFMGAAWLSRHLDTSLQPLFTRACSLHSWDHLTVNTSIPGCRAREFATSWAQYEQRLRARSIFLPQRITILQHRLLRE